MGRRLIPAHAGKTAHAQSGASGHAAHPRSRGENGLVAAALATFAGSSPLTRGKPYGAALADLRVGLIPAHAGKTIFFSFYGSACWGSSPLTRGKPSRDAARNGCSGLIPAHAGKTS